MVEWKVLKNSVVWTSRINSEDLAYEHINECVEKGEGDFEEFSVEQMTEKEI